MSLEIIKQSGTWLDAYYFMLNTWRDTPYPPPDPTLAMKRRIAFARHSPLKTVRYIVKCTVPNKAQNHLVRHNAGIDWFVQTLRTDLKDVQDIEVHRLTPRSVSFEINGIAFFNLYKVRICRKAEKETREFAKLLRKKISEFDEVWDFAPIWTNPCTDCREIAFKPCPKRKRLPNSFFLKT